MFSDLIFKVMGAPKMYLEGDSGGANGGGSTVITAGGGDPGVGGGGTADTGGGDGGSADSGGDSGTHDHAWMAQLPDDLKGNEALAGFSTIGELSKGFLELHGSSEGKVSLPSEDATPEAKAEAFKGVMKHFGLPETAEGYEFKKPENMPDGVPYDEARVQEFAKVAHELALPKDTAQAIVKWSDDKAMAEHKEALESIQKANTERLETMKTEYGDNFKAVAESAHRAAQGFGSEDFMGFLEDTGLGDHPLMIEFCHNISKAISEDSARIRLDSGGKEAGPLRDNTGRPRIAFKSMGDKAG